MKIILYIILLPLFLYKTYAFQHTQTSVSKKDTITTSFLNTLSTNDLENLINTKVDQKTHNEALLIAEHLLKNVLNTNDYLTQIKAYNWLSYIHYIIGNQKKVIQYSQKGVDLYTSKKLISVKNIIFNLLLFQGAAHTNIGEYENAITIYYKANDLLDPQIINEQKLSNILSISHCRIRIKRYKDAIKDCQFVINSLKNKKIYNSISNYNKISIPFSANNRLGIAYREMNKYDKAIEIFLKNIDSSIAHSHKINLAVSNMNTGISYHRKKDFTIAEKFLQKAKHIFESENDSTQNYRITQYHIADILHQGANYKEAQLYIQNIVHELSKNSKIEYAVEMMELAINNAKKLKNIDNQLAYTEQLSIIQKKLYNDRNTTKDFIFDKDTAILKSNNHTLQSSNKKGKIITVSLIIFLLASGVLVLFYLKKTKQKNQLLFDQLEYKLSKKEKELKNSIKNKKTNTIKVDNQKATTILEKLNDLEKTLFFKNQNCTLHATAQVLETNTSYLSKIINQYKQQSFNDYINELRIYYALEQIKKDTKYKSYTIKGISEDIGYKSVNTFNNAFKRITNISPSYYLKQINQNNLIHSQTTIGLDT